MKKMCAKCGGSMKKGGTVKKVKKMAQGGQMYGIPQTGTTNYSAPTMAMGGMMKKYKTGGIEDPQPSKSKSALKSPTQQLAQMSRSDYRDIKKGAKREAKLNRITSGKQGDRVDNLIRTGAGVVESAARISRAAADMKKGKKGGSLKPVPSNKVGLSKLPTAVRNKMGFQKKGGPIKKK